MSRKSLFFVFLYLALPGLLPLLADPSFVIQPGNMGCTVAITSHMNSPLPDPSQPATDSQPKISPVKTMKSAEVVRVGKLQHETLTYTDGDTSEAWTMVDTGLTLVEKNAGPSKFIYELPAGSAMRNVVWPSMLDLTTSSLSWINPQNLVSPKATFHGKQALHYQVNRSIPAVMGPPVAALYQAWVAPKTFTLIALDDGNALYELTFFEPPSEPLVLPPLFQKDLNKYKNANAAPGHY